MNDTENKSSEPSFFTSIAKDEGVQRAAAGVVIAVIVAGVKKALFAS